MAEDRDYLRDYVFKDCISMLNERIAKVEDRERVAKTKFNTTNESPDSAKFKQLEYEKKKESLNFVCLVDIREAINAYSVSGRRESDAVQLLEAIATQHQKWVSDRQNLVSERKGDQKSFEATDSPLTKFWKEAKDTAGIGTLNAIEQVQRLVRDGMRVMHGDDFMRKYDAGEFKPSVAAGRGL